MKLKYKTLHEYWENNIDKFSGFYDKVSEENIVGNSLVTFFYKKCLFPIEKQYMKIRYDYVINYINANVKDGISVADVGCGSGIFTKEMAKFNAKIYALDFAQTALNLTEQSLTEENKKLVFLKKLDIQYERIPEVDCCIVIGVLPYIKNTISFFDNVLPYTNQILINFLDADNFLNKLRKLFTFLNVRGYYYQAKSDVLNSIEKYGFKIIDVKKLATGYIISAKK